MVDGEFVIFYGTSNSRLTIIVGIVLVYFVGFMGSSIPASVFKVVGFSGMLEGEMLVA